MSETLGMCYSCIKLELDKVVLGHPVVIEKKTPKWIVIELTFPLSHFRNDLLRLSLHMNEINEKNFCIESTLHNSFIPFSNIKGDQETLIVWFNYSKSINGLFLNERTKSSILVAPNADISALRTYIREYQESKQNEIGKQVSLSRYTATQHTYSRKEPNNYNDENFIDYEIDLEKYDRELEHEFQWETEQSSLDDALEEWENNRGYGLTTYDDTDDYDY